MAMADGYGLFWNSDSGDRKYDAQSFEKWLKKFFTSGVFEGDLQVLASSGMTVQVQTGYANVNGKVGLFESSTNVTLSAANSRYPRIDTIVIERNDVDRVIRIDKVTGAYTGENPQPTAPIWDETQGIYQLVLAQIYVGAGVSSISQEDITDKRTDTDVCGYITGTVNEMDFSQFTAQFEAYFSTFEATQLAEFEEWFDHMKDQLDSDAAGHLQAEVDEINEMIAPIQLTLTASQPYAIGEQFIYGGKLYTATSAIAEDATIVIGTNASLSAEIVKQIKNAKDAIGNLSSLTTTDKLSAVAAINEVDAHADTAQTSANTVQAQVSDSGDAYSTSKAYAVGDLCIYNNVLYRCITACSAGSWATNQSCFTADTLVNVADRLSADTKQVNYIAVKYGVVYSLSLMGNMGIFSIKTGSLNTNIASNGTLVSLSDFSSDLASKKFYSSYQFVATTDTTKRITTDSDTGNITTVSALASGYSPRGTVPFVIY